MTFSTLTNELKPVRHAKYQSRLGLKPRYVIVHHWAGVGVIDFVLNKFVYNKNQSSVNYIMRNTGHLIGSVSENYRAWTSNNYLADLRGITIEIENETGAPSYQVSAASIEKLTNLLVDLAIRYGWKQIRFGHEVRGHREFYATSCPGPYLWPRLPTVAKEANRRLQARRNHATTNPKEGIVSMKRTSSNYNKPAQPVTTSKWKTLDVQPTKKSGARIISFAGRNTNPALAVIRARIAGLGHNDYIDFMIYHLKYDAKKGNGPINGILRHRIYGAGAQTDQPLSSYLDLTRALNPVPAGHRWRIRAQASKPGVTVSNLAIDVFQ